MADVLDVINAIAADVTTATINLRGTTYLPPVAIDAETWGEQTCGSVQVFPGQQLLRTLMTRLEVGKNQIGIADDEHEIKCDQYIDLPNYLPANATAPVPMLDFSVSANGKVATLTGTIQAGDVFGVSIGGVGAGYAVLEADTLATIATAFGAACTTAGILNSVSGVTVTILQSGEPQFAVGTSYVVNQEIWRRRKIVFADLHAHSVYDMQYIGRFVESMYNVGHLLTLVDGSQARVLGFDTIDFKDQQRDGAYLRRFRWLVDFTTTQQSTVTQVVAVTDFIAGLIPGSTTTATAPTASQL